MDGPSSPYCSCTDVGTDVPIKNCTYFKIGKYTNILSTVFIVH